MITKTKVHGYKNNIVSNFCKKRYPYISENDSNKSKGVFKSINFRIFQNLSKILKDIETPEIERKEAFLVLNELSNHPEQKVEMIEKNFIEICSNYLVTKNKDILYESLRLMGSLVSIKLGRDRLKSDIIGNLEIIIQKGNRHCREVLGWVLCRIVSGDDGVDFILKNGFIQAMVNSFFVYSKDMKKENLKFLEYLLFSFEKLLQEDTAILSFTENNVLELILKILGFLDAKKDFFKCHRINLILLLLNCIGCITMNPDGKEEAVRLKTYKIIEPFLSYNNDKVLNYSVRILMFISIHLEGKLQIIDYENDKIILKIINILNRNDDIKSNCYQLLINLSENKKGFLKITKYLSSNSTELIKIFDRECIIPLFLLVKEYSIFPFFKDKNDIEKIKQYLNPIFEYLENQKEIEELYDRAIIYINENINNLIGNLLPFILIKDDVKFQNHLFELFYELISKDKLNVTYLNKTFEKINNFYSEITNTSIKAELEKIDIIYTYIKNK